MRDGVSTYYLGVNRNKRSDRPRPQGPRRRRGGAGAGPARRRPDRELPAGRPGAVRARLRRPSRRPTRASSTPRSAASAAAPKGAALPGYDLIVQAISGLMSLTGDPDGEPYRAGISVFDVMAGLHATIGILAAVNLRHETGRGQHVEVNLLSSALSGLVNQSSAYVAGGVVPMRMGNSHPSLFPYEPLPCADGDLIITAGNNGQFRKLVEVLGVPELADDPRFAAQRGPHRQPRAAAAAAGRAAAHPQQGRLVPRHHRGRCARAVRSTPSTAGSPSPRRSASTRSSWSARATPRCRRCATRSGSPRPPPTTGCHRRASTSTATRSDAGSTRRRS